MAKCQLHIQDLGKIAYEPALQKQRAVQQSVIEHRGDDSISPFHLLLLEHDPPVITLSKRKAVKDHLIATEVQLKSAGVEVCQTDRGGDITYHGPGQLVGYSICDLNALHLRLHGYMRFLEACIIEVLDVFSIEGQRDECATGVWVDGSKISAMGVRSSRWVTMHGFAFNINTNLEYFNNIVPCGISDKPVTSLKKELNKEIDVNEVKKKLKKHFAQLFEAEFI